MTTPSASLNVYYTRPQPARAAQEKYTSAAWNERYLYITIAALTAVAAVANIFIAALMAPVSLLLLNAAVIAITAKLAMPWVMDWFAKSDKFRAQAMKEEKIHAVQQELRAKDPDALSQEFHNRGINYHHLADAELRDRPQVVLLARVIYYETRSEALEKESVQLAAADRHRECIEARFASVRATAKAAFFAMLIEHPDIRGTFKELFKVVNISLEDRAILNVLDEDLVPDVLLQTRGQSPRIIRCREIANRQSGFAADTLYHQL